MTQVLCIKRSALTSQGVPTDAVAGVYNFDLSKCQESDFSFLERSVVDDSAVGENSAIGIENPQVLGYVVVRNGNKFLSYSRKHTPNEQRLKDLRSIGFGGHADFDESYNSLGVIQFMHAELRREMAEELCVPSFNASFATAYNKVLIDMRDDKEPEKVAVGKVHMGYVYQLPLTPELVQETREAQDLKWLDLSELLADIDSYETWSQLLIKGFLEAVI